jgi:division protein CdvB (Snf7/Vps24/ESCRT-III family)
VLAHLGYRPDDETAAQAADRLQAVSGSARRALIEASRNAERRAREIRAALEAKEAQESADKWTRE